MQTLRILKKMDNSILLKNIFLFGTTSTITVIVLVIYLFNRPDKFEHWMNIFYRILYSVSSSFPKFKRKIDRRLVAVSIQDVVNNVCNSINREATGAIPHALKIQWVKTDAPDSFISKGIAVVRLKHYGNQDKNIVNATLIYLKQAFLPRVKNYMDKTLCRGCEYKVASKIFIKKLDSGAYDFFMKDELEPAVLENKELEEDIKTINNMDSSGVFTRIFLTEVTLTGKKLLGSVPTARIKNELRSFAKFLEIIATKGKDENVPLTFSGSTIKTAVILVAKQETISAYGINPYINRLGKSIKSGCDSIYLTGWGDESVSAVVNIKRKVEKKMVTILNRFDYQLSNEIKAILICAQTQSSYLIQKKNYEDEVRPAFAAIVSEIKEGEVEIVNIAREKDIGFKVAVRSNKPDTCNAIHCCIGENKERIQKLKDRFGDEFISILDWSEDPEQYIRNSLRPVMQHSIGHIQLNEEDLIANTYVNNKQSLRKGIGRKGFNVKLASELTGWHINLELTPAEKGLITPEEEVETLLKNEIPEIMNQEIEIVKIARIKGYGSRVIVKWTKHHNT
jgi:transcription antitermination factor NusA-like protein